MSDAQVVVISTLDETTGLLHDAYVIERGERLQVEPHVPVGFSRHVMETREPLLIAEDASGAAERYGNPQVLTGEPVRSAIFVPLVASGKSTGVISLQNLDRERAFTDLFHPFPAHLAHVALSRPAQPARDRTNPRA